MTWGLKKTAALIIGIYLLFCAGLLYWVVIYSGSGDGDTLEHVHSSWLVWSGKIPYKDFFQHHNPRQEPYREDNLSCGVTAIKSTWHFRQSQII